MWKVCSCQHAFDKIVIYCPNQNESCIWQSFHHPCCRHRWCIWICLWIYWLYITYGWCLQSFLYTCLIRHMIKTSSLGITETKHKHFLVSYFPYTNDHYIFKDLISYVEWHFCLKNATYHYGKPQKLKRKHIQLSSHFCACRWPSTSGATKSAGIEMTKFHSCI